MSGRVADLLQGFGSLPRGQEVIDDQNPIRRTKELRRDVKSPSGCLFKACKQNTTSGFFEASFKHLETPGQKQQAVLEPGLRTQNSLAFHGEGDTSTL